MEYDNWERLKPFDAKEGTTEGESMVIPTEDNDQKLYFYDVQGESVYTNPPDSNLPSIDHGLDEEHIWAFNNTGYNQFVIKNQYTTNLWNATKATHAPFWGQKLMTPSFYKEDKLPRFYRQWESRLGLEIVKMRHAITNKPGDIEQRKRQKEEIEAYIQSAYRKEMDAELKNVYVTDHTPKQRKYATINSQEDEQFYRYKQALQDYNSEAHSGNFATFQRERYPRGSLLQRIFDPLAGAQRLENGAIFYEV